METIFDGCSNLTVPALKLGNAVLLAFQLPRQSARPSLIVIPYQLNSKLGSLSTQIMPFAYRTFQSTQLPPEISKCD